MVAHDLDSRTRDIGKEIFARARRAESTGDGLAGESWIDRALMKFGMRDEHLKAQLFRFVDVLPALSHARAGQPPPPRVPRRTPASTCRRCSAGRSGWLPRDGFARRPPGRRSPGPTPAGWPGGSSPASNLAEALARRRGRCGAVAGVHHRPARRGDDHRRPRPSSTRREYLDLIDGLCRRGQRLAGRSTLIDRDHRGPAAARQRLGQAVVALQPVRPDRPGRHQRGRPATGCGRSCALAARARRVRQHRHGAVRLQGPDAPHLPGGPRRRRVPRLARRRHRHPGVSARLRRRPARPAPTGPSGAARRCGCGSSRAPTGTTRRSSPPRTAGRVPVFAQKWETDANYERQTRVPAREPRRAAAGVRQPQHPQPRPRAGRWPSDCGLPPRGYEFQMLYGMADPIKDGAGAAWASACASTRRTASCCRAWPTSCAGCWRTRPTSRSCGPASPSTCPRSSC